MFFSFICAALLACAPAPKTPVGSLLLGPQRARSGLKSPLAAGAKAPASSVDPCKIYGAIYLETNPARRAGCFAIVYVEPNAGLADLLVFKETNKLFADSMGLWADSPSREFADYALFVTTDRGLADFTIHYTDVRAFAGCKTQ